MPTRLLITVMQQDKVRQQHSFEASSIMLGRNAPCNVLLNDPGVSRMHAEISCEAGAYYINDLGSANGTLLNGVLQERAPLKSGDVVTIAGFQLHIALAPPSAQQGPDTPMAGTAERTLRASHAKPRQ